ncbi:MAG: 23S rRNA (pseudouridine(1915)-N(3))-methyltransferase RlmH [Bacteroidia bacterium]
MKVTLILVGKTEEKWAKEGLAVYLKRLQHYLPFAVLELAAGSGKADKQQMKEQEGLQILKAAGNADRIFLLDDKGTHYTSEELAVFFQKQMNGSVKHLVFAAGGAYGFSEAVYKKANGLISLSKMTFTHQMVRLIFTEQAYRAMTIIKGEKYHHS